MKSYNAADDILLAALDDIDSDEGLFTLEEITAPNLPQHSDEALLQEDIPVLSDVDWSSNAIFCILDQKCDDNDPEYCQKTLPANLYFSASASWDETLAESSCNVGVWAKETIPFGCRFGPFYSEETRNVHGKQANWMRFVQPAASSQIQNMVAYQEGEQV